MSNKSNSFVLAVFFTVLFLDALKGKEKTSEFNTKVLMT
jgi:hypothetical protein